MTWLVLAGSRAQSTTLIELKVLPAGMLMSKKFVAPLGAGLLTGSAEYWATVTVPVPVAVAVTAVPVAPVDADGLVPELVSDDWIVAAVSVTKNGRAEDVPAVVSTVIWWVADVARRAGGTAKFIVVGVPEVG